MVLVTVEVELKEGEGEPKPKLDEGGECISSQVRSDRALWPS